MTELANLRRALAESSRFVQGIWQDSVMGAQQIPGVPEVRAPFQLRQRYAESIILGDQLAIPDAGFLRRFIIATASVARDLEYGRGPWDMKPMLLGGPKARISKKGNRYNIIPFRHGAGSQSGRDARFQQMPKDVLGAARALAPSFSMMAPVKIRTSKGMETVMRPKGIKWGEKLGAMAAHPPGQNKTTGYQHKNGIYEGMHRIRKHYENATQSQYLTFRIVSDKSDPQSWWHPGYKAHHIATAVADYVKPSVEAMIRDAARLDCIPPGELSIGMQVTTRV